MKGKPKLAWSSNARACYPHLQPAQPHSFAVMKANQVLITLQEASVCVVLYGGALETLYDHIESVLFTPKERIRLIRARQRLRRARSRRDEPLVHGIRIADARFAGGFNEMKVATAKEARERWENVRRKMKRGYAELVINGDIAATL